MTVDMYTHHLAFGSNIFHLGRFKLKLYLSRCHNLLRWIHTRRNVRWNVECLAQNVCILISKWLYVKGATCLGPDLSFNVNTLLRRSNIGTKHSTFHLTLRPVYIHLRIRYKITQWWCSKSKRSLSASFHRVEDLPPPLPTHYTLSFLHGNWKYLTERIGKMKIR